MPHEQRPDDTATLARTAATLLRHTVTLAWESVDQVLREHARADLGDPAVAGTAAWHLMHIAGIFRLHARTVMHDPRAATPDDPPLPTDPAQLRATLLADIEGYNAWLTRQPPAFFAAPVEYGRSHTFLEMTSVMTQHITWHAAAIHYWVRWGRASISAKQSATRGQ